MELIGKLKEKVEKAKTKDEKKKIIEEKKLLCILYIHKSFLINFNLYLYFLV